MTAATADPAQTNNSASASVTVLAAPRAPGRGRGRTRPSGPRPRPGRRPPPSSWWPSRGSPASSRSYLSPRGEEHRSSSCWPISAQACTEYKDAAIRNLDMRSGSSATRFGRSATPRRRTCPRRTRGTFGYGDVWTWTAIDADTKLVPSWLVGERTHARTAYTFLQDLAVRLLPRHRVQLTTDGIRRRTRTPSMRVSATRSTTRQIIKEYYSPAEGSHAATRPPRARRSGQAGSSAATPTRRTSQPATSNARTSPCGWVCAGSPG